LSLIKHHPWNNFLQIKTQAIFEEMLGSRTHNQFKFDVIRENKVLEALVDLSESPNFRFNE